MNKPRISRRDFATSLTSMGVAAAAAAHADEPQVVRRDEPWPDVTLSGEPLNIIWIVWDTARFDSLSLHGNSLSTTPYLDRFSTECQVFNKAYAASNWTGASQASMFTGVYPSWHGASGYTGLQISPAVPTLAELLGRVGYDTVNISANGVVSSKNAGRGFAVERLIPNEFRPIIFSKGAPMAHGIAGNWLQKRDRSKPFFLSMNVLEPHEPYQRLDPMNLFRFLEEPIDMSAQLQDWRKRKIFTKKNRAHGITSHFESRDTEILRHFYAANIAYLDMHLGAYLKPFLT